MTKLSKAGLIPYFVNPDGSVEFLFMVSSDPAYGGDKPMVSKGGIDEGETEAIAAIREAVEELGLKEENLVGDIKPVWFQNTSGMTEDYNMTIFVGEVKSKTDFLIPHYETSHTVWMTAKQFYKKGRSSHAGIISTAVNFLQS
jgi:8-oxo-dGTP pyrophosphatase MutT (NUDIX family)